MLSVVHSWVFILLSAVDSNDFFILISAVDSKDFLYCQQCTAGSFILLSAVDSKDFLYCNQQSGKLGLRQKHKKYHIYGFLLEMQWTIISPSMESKRVKFYLYFAARGMIWSWNINNFLDLASWSTRILAKYDMSPCSWWRQCNKCITWKGCHGNQIDVWSMHIKRFCKVKRI